MAYSTFCQTPNNARLEPMFMGQSVNVARYDVQKYEVFEKLIEKQILLKEKNEKLSNEVDKIKLELTEKNQQISELNDRVKLLKIVKRICHLTKF